MYSKHAEYRFALYLLKHIFQKGLCRVINIWRKSEKIQMLSPSKSKLQKSASISISTPNKSNCNNLKDFKRPYSAKPLKVNDSPKDFGERLHNIAKEIELKKEEFRKSLEPEYTFTPKLSTNTKKWLISKSKKELKNSYEEVAVVSGSSVLQYTNFTPNVKNLINSKRFMNQYPENGKKIQKVRILKRSERPLSQIPAFIEEIENKEAY